MASITEIKLKPGTSWRVHIRLHNLKPITKQFHLKSEAIAFARKIEGEYAFAESLSDASNTWSSDCKIPIPVSKKEYSVPSLLNFWTKEYGKIKFSSIDAKTIRQGLNKIKQRGVAECPLNQCKASLSSVFEFAKEEHETTHKPCREVKAKTEDKGSQADKIIINWKVL